MKWFHKRDPAAEAARVDELTLKALRDQGADLSQPRRVMHHLRFPSREAALAVAESMRADGYTVALDRSAIGETWLARAETTAVVSAESCARDRARFVILAAASGGEYDGWEASATP